MTPSTSASGAGQRRCRAVGGRAVRQGGVLAEREQGDDGQVRGRAASLLDRDLEVIDQRERLEPEEVDAALEQAVDGLAERTAYGRLVEVQEVAGGWPERSDGSRDEDVAAGDVASLARQLRAAPSQATGLVAEAEGRQPRPIGAEGRGRDDVRAGREVLAVDRADQLWPRRDELVEHGPLRDAPREQERAHGAVGQEWAGGEALAEPGTCVHQARSLAEQAVSQPSAAMVPRRRPRSACHRAPAGPAAGRGRPLYAEPSDVA